MTIRQFLSLLLSSIVFLHPLSLGQWTGASIVFGVLYVKEAWLKSASGHKHGGDSTPHHPVLPTYHQATASSAVASGALEKQAIS